MNGFRCFRKDRAVDRKEAKDPSIIPPGPYCYTYIDDIFCICPYWEMRLDKEYQDNGYCHFLEQGDLENV